MSAPRFALKCINRHAGGLENYLRILGGLIDINRHAGGFEKVIKMISGKV